jgi:raffinose/stachyose/melibiose transport system substrate-binding protein
MKSTRFRLAVAALAALPLLAVAACGGGSDAGSSDGKTEISLLIDNTPGTVALAEGVVAAFEKANPTITVKIEQRPGGSDGDNLVKTKLSTGEMEDVFWYNSGSLLQALAPAKSLVDLTGDPVIKDVDPAYLPVVSQDNKVYGAPWGSSFAGGILYNKAVYAKFGLQVPKTWSEFLSNSDKIKAGGLTAIQGSFKDTWTTQLIVLGDYSNVQKAVPTFAADYTANKAKYASTPAALKSFQKMAELTAGGYYNKGAGSTTEPQAMTALAAGKAGQYPMLSASVAELKTPEQLSNIGFFGLPGDDASSAVATIWEPNGQYIPKAGKNIEAAKKFVAFTASVPGTLAMNEAVPPTGPYRIIGSKLPDDAPQAAKDLQGYVDSKATIPALEFLSPVKGPSLEQITTAVATGQTPAQAAAEQYDKDVTKQAKQLGLAGW